MDEMLKEDVVEPCESPWSSRPADSQDERRAAFLSRRWSVRVAAIIGVSVRVGERVRVKVWVEDLDVRPIIGKFMCG